MVATRSAEPSDHQDEPHGHHRHPGQRPESRPAGRGQLRSTLVLHRDPSHRTDSSTQGCDIIRVKAVGNRAEMALQGGSRTVQGLGGISIGPAKHHSEHPGFPPSISAAGRPVPMLEDRKPLPPGPVGNPTGDRPPMLFRQFRRLAEGVEQASDPPRPRRSRGSGSSRGAEVVEQTSHGG